jgi:hypothetical protein
MLWQFTPVIPMRSWQDDLVNQLPSILTGLGTLITLIVGVFKLRQGQQDAATTAKATHALVNSDHGVTLRLAATTLQRVADLTQVPADMKAAIDAKFAADQHDKAQSALNTADPPK